MIGIPDQNIIPGFGSRIQIVASGGSGAGGTPAVTLDTKFEKGFASPATSPVSFVSNAGTVSGSVGSNSNRILIIYLVFDNGTVTPNGTPTWNGVSSTQLGTFVSIASSGQTIYLYRLLAPTTGAQTLSAAFNAGSSAVVLGAISLFNVDQVTGANNYQSTTGTGTAESISVTSVSNLNMIVGGSGDNNASSFTITAPAVLDFNETSFNGNFQLTHTAANGGSTTIAATLGSSVNWASAAVEVLHA